MTVASGKTLEKVMRCSDLIGNYERVAEKITPPERVIRLCTSRSNRQVLNSAAARLGQALRETQDVLQRDNLEATASVINCVNGTNGRQEWDFAVVKSSLIDFKAAA